MKFKFRQWFCILLCLSVVVTTLSVPIPVKAAGTVGSIFTSGPNPFYSVGQTFGIEVQDADLNTGAETQETVEVAVISTSDTTGFNVTLTEDGNDSGRFIGEVKIAGATNTGVTPKEIQGVNGNRITVTYNDATTSDDPVALSTYVTVADLVFQGTVSNPDSSAASAGNIDVHDSNDQFLGSYPVKSDGSFAIPVDKNKSYKLRAMPSGESTYMYSQWTDLSVNSEGVYTPSSLNLILQEPLFSGTVKDSEGALIDGDKFHISIRPTDGQPGNGFSYDWMGRNGSFKVANISKDGTYAIKAVSNDSNHTDSFEQSFTITGGVLSGAIPDFNLVFTSPQLAGTVTYPDELGAKGGNVEIFDSNMNYLSCVPIDNSTNGYQIGGLANGTYKIRANPNDKSKYMYSDVTSIEISGGAPLTVNLEFKEKQLILKNVDSFFITDNELRLRVDNISLINNLNDLSATVSVGGSSITLTYSRKDGPWEGGDEAELFFNVPINTFTSFGRYTVEVLNNGSAITSENNTLDVIQRLSTSPWTVELSQYRNSGVALSIDVQGEENKKQYPWGKDQVLTVEAVNSQTGVVEEIREITVPDGNKFSFTIAPKADAVSGNRSIKVYDKLTSRLLAMNGIEVGTCSFDAIYANDGSRNVMVTGAFLDSYPQGSTRAKLCMGSEAIDSTNTNINGNIFFDFDYSFKTGVSYTLKMYVNDVEINSLPLGGVFSATPRLDCVNPVILRNNNPEQSITINESSIEGLGWEAGDTTITVYVNGRSAYNYSETAGTNLTVNGNNLVLKLTAGEGRSFPLESGFYNIDVFKGGKKVGYAEIIAVESSDDILTGTLMTSGGNPSIGGFININKQNKEGWGSGCIVGHDGKFYIWKGMLPPGEEVGSYDLTVIPPDDSSDTQNSTTVYYNGSNFQQNNNTVNNISINLLATQISGTVKAGGNPFWSGNVDVNDLNHNRITSVQVASDGTYKIGGLNTGSYYLIANAPWESNYFSSSPVEINYDGAPITQELNLSAPQITGTAKDTDGNNLDGDKYDVDVRPIKADNGFCEPRTRNGQFIIGNMGPGEYAVSIRPRGPSTMARSEEVKVTVYENGSVEPNTPLALSLTAPEVAGTVTKKDGTALTEGYVEIWQGPLKSLNGMGAVPIVSYEENGTYKGTYKIGGLPKGKYYIRAAFDSGSIDYAVNSPSVFTEVTVGDTPVTQDLALTNREQPRILWVNDTEVGSGFISLRILNYKGKDIKKFSAELLDISGDPLVPGITMAGSEIKLGWNNSNSDEADLELYLGENKSLSPGSYKLKLLYDDKVVAFDNAESAEAFRVYYPLSVIPKGAQPVNTPGLSLKLFVDDRRGGYLSGIWGASDTLTAKIISSTGTVYSGIACTKNADSTLTAGIPTVLTEGKLPDGWNTIELYNGTTLLAKGGIIVGAPVFEGVNTANEGDNCVSITGKYLASYENATTAEILDNATNNVLLTTTDNCFMGDRLEFYFKDVRLPAGQYKFRLSFGGSVVDTKAFNVVPRLICEPHAISGESAVTITIKNSSTVDAFKWQEADDIEDFEVFVFGDGFNYSQNSTNGLSFSNDGNRNLVVTISTESYPLNKGNGQIDIIKNGNRIGYSKFTIGYDVISGTVTEPNEAKTPIANATVKVTNLNNDDNCSFTVISDSEGRFYISKQDMPRNSEDNLSGNYSFFVTPPKGSSYAAVLKTFEINASTTNNIDISLAAPQISGIVKAGVNPMGGGTIEVQQKINDHEWKYLFDVDVDSDGSFRIGGLMAGTYYIKAHENKNASYVSSNFTELDVGGTTITGLVIPLNPVQVRGAVTFPDGSILKSDQYWINIKSLDVDYYKDNLGEWRREDGIYRIGALKPGNYSITLRPNRDSVYSQSYEATFTINSDGSASDDDIPLKLTEPKLTGTVIYDTDKPFTEGYVDIFKGTFSNNTFVTSAELDKEGKFRIGGLPNGTYYIRAALWSNSSLKSTYSQSVLTEIELVDNTAPVQLALTGKTPRIRCIYDSQIEDRQLVVEIVNISGITDFSKLSIEILNSAGNSFSPKIEITGANNFYINKDWVDQDKDQGNLFITIDKNIVLEAGKYKLRFKYNDVELANETSSEGGFNILYNLMVDPYAVVPEATNGKVLELSLDMDKTEYPWAPSDTLTVDLLKKDGSVIPLTPLIAEDKTLTATIGQALPIGEYTIRVFKGTDYLARGGLTVGYPLVEGIADGTEEQTEVTVYGQNLVVYMDGLVSKIYDSTGTNLLLTSEGAGCRFGDIFISLNGKTLAPGEYVLKMNYNGGAITLPNEGKFKVVDILNVTPVYMLASQTSGKTVKLTSADGIEPWNAGDSLEIYINMDGVDNGALPKIIPATANVTADSISFTLPADSMYSSHCSIRAYKVTGTNTSVFIGYAHFQIIDTAQMKGTIKNTEGAVVPYSSVYIRKSDDDKFGMGFDADSEGKFAVYGLEPGNYTVYAAPPKDAAYIDSTGFGIIINADGTSNSTAHDFVLQPARRISGTVKLPGTEKAPVGGLNVWVAVWMDNGTPDDKDDDYWTMANPLISFDTNSVEYSAYVPVNDDVYFVQAWCDGGGLVNTGVYYKNSEGSVFTQNDATKVSVAEADQTGINIFLSHGTEISGTVALPSGAVASTGGLKVNVNAAADKGTENPYDDINAGMTVTIPGGQQSVSYKLVVPAASGYVVGYEADSSGYLFNGYYKTGPVTTYARQLASSVDASLSNQSGINLELIKAKYIKGYVSLPIGQTAPTNGLEGWIGAVIGLGTDGKNNDNWFGTNFKINQGNNKSGEYSISVPVDVNEYIVELWCSGANLINGPTYYGASGSVFSVATATSVVFAQADTEKKGIDITLVNGKTISGTINIPTAAPSGGRGMTIQAIMDNGTPDNKKDDVVVDIKVVIPATQTSTTYTLSVPEKSGYRVLYISDPLYQYEENGFYYSSTESKYDYASATTLDLSTNKTGINLFAVNALNPVCTKAVVSEDGATVKLSFSKALSAPLPVCPAGFTLKVKVNANGIFEDYQIDSVQLDEKGTMLTLGIKDYKIFKDYTDIKISYSATAGIQSYDGKALESFTDMAVENKSVKVLSIVTGFSNGALLNKKAVIKVTSDNDAITIKEGETIIKTGNGSITGEVTADGLHTITISIAGRKNDASVTFTIDTIPPTTVSISNFATVKNVQAGVVPTIAFSSDCVAETKVITINGRTYNATTSDGGLTYTGSAIREAGHYVLVASAKDQAGNVKTDKKEFDVIWDTSLPVITITRSANTGIENGGIYGNVVLSIRLDADAATIAAGNSNASNYSYTASLKKPDGSVVAFNKNSIPSITNQGTYRLEVVALNPSYTDITSTKVVEFTLDTTAPTASIAGVTANGKYNTAVTPIITFDDNSVASQQTLLKNANVTLTRGGSAVAYNMGESISIDGEYVLTAETKDGLDQVSNTASVSFAIDRTKPVITLSGALNGTTYKDQNVTITATVNEGTLTVVDGSGKTIELAGNQHTFTGTADTVTTYTVIARAVDAAGNNSEQQLSFTIDRLAVNITVSGVSEGMLVNCNPYITFTTFVGTEEKDGTTVTIDGAAFTGGNYSTEGNHVLVAKYKSGDTTYEKTINFKIDKTAPTITVNSVLKNGSPNADDLVVKAGDSVKVRANVTDMNGVGSVSFKLVNLAEGKSVNVTGDIPMIPNQGEGYYEGEYIVQSGDFNSLSLVISATDKAGNITSKIHTKHVTIDNTKPLVSLVTNPMVADGFYGIFKAESMSLELTASSSDTITYNFNNVPGTATGSKSFTPAQGTNILIYSATDTAGNISDQKAYVFEYDSIKPANVSELSSPASDPTAGEFIKISGKVSGEGAKTGTAVLLKKNGEVIAKASVKADSSFEIGSVKLVEGLNTFTLIAVDRAGNESATSATLEKTLDSTAPALKAEKVNDTNYTVTANENISKPTAKFNGIDIGSQFITASPTEPDRVFNIVTSEQVEGINTLNVMAVDLAGNTGTGSYTSTYIPANMAQEGLQLNDNTTMDIPGDAFDTQTQMLVKTVDVKGITEYKTLGSAISFEFKKEGGLDTEPAKPVIVRNFIGIGLTGVVLMHVNSNGVVDSTVTAKIRTSNTFETSDGNVNEDDDTIDDMIVDTPYYISDTGYLVFKTKNFSSYQVAQDNTAPVISVSTADFVINKADYDAGGMKIAGTITDNDPKVAITQVMVDGNVLDISGIAAGDLDKTFSIVLSLTDGAHEVVIKATDSAGNSSTVTRNYSVDITQPSLTAIVATNTTSSPSIDVLINTGENSEVFLNGVSKGYFNGGGIIPCALNDGAANTINVSATDAFGNTANAAQITVTRDSTAPAITITGVNDGDVYGSEVTITVAVEDLHNPQHTIKLDNADFTSGQKCSSEGQHTLVVTASDSYGNTDTRTVTFAIDTSVPVISITGATNNGIYSANKTLSITAENTDAIFVTKFTDGQAAEDVASAVNGTVGTSTVVLGVDGQQHTYKIVVTARKTVGAVVRTATSTVNVIVDRKNPVVTSTTTTTTESATINITGTVDETADIYLNNTLVITANAAGGFTISGQNLNAGANAFVIKAIDTVGNISTINISITRTQPAGNNGGNTGGDTGGSTGGNIGGPISGSVGGSTDGATENPADNKTDNPKDDSDTAESEITGPEPIAEKPVLKGTIATATTTAAEFNEAINKAVKDSEGVKTVAIELESVKGAKTYSEVLPVSVMKETGGKLKVEIQSPLGTVTVPGNMFTDKALENKKTVGISIAMADKSKLSAADAKAIGNKPVIELKAIADGKTLAWSNPNAPVTVSIPYKPTVAELKNPDHIVIWYIDGSGKVQAVPNGRYDTKTGTVTFTTTHFSKYAVAYVVKTFNDIKPLGAGKAKIELVVSKGIMSGKTATAFSPYGKVTRGEFIAYLVRTLNLEAEVIYNFADVKKSSPYYREIGIALKLGILKGTSKSMLYPDKYLTKEDMAVFIVSAMKAAGMQVKSGKASDLARYSDSGKVKSTSAESIATLIKTGVLSIPGKKIDPQAYVNRAQIAGILYYLYKNNNK